MIRKFILTSFILFASFFYSDLHAQDNALKNAPVHRIGIFAPLYLDSVFSKNTFRYKQSLPRFIMPAVDFVQGALIALDSLQAGDDYINATVYDTKSYTEPIAELIREKKLDSLQLIIGSVRDEDYIQLADFALNKNIPFISATYPNDGGITGNPFLVIMNSTLKAHCDAIYSYLLQNHGTDKIYLCRQPGAQEDRVASYFKRINEQDGKPLLPIETLNIENSNLNAAFLRSKLDSNRKSVIIGGSLDENFATALAKACFAIQKSYPLTLVGMPNWDNFSALFNKKEMADLPIYYTTTYYNDKSDGFSKALVAAYQKKYKSKPSDMAFKGYESVYLFTKKLAKNPDDFMSRINDKNTRIFCDYNFREVRMNEQSTVPDYFENKHLYLIKILNGTISKAW
ncbi:MAG TPA: ABC transporter substrate-binding protein [Ferruginibacter sp.]|jgi:ABC-type branched-subunit amino acid transport system substrate-binding protein|nr:ABC transporter substrate-binding protein [Ferruginibacter sp.]